MTECHLESAPLQPISPSTSIQENTSDISDIEISYTNIGSGYSCWAVGYLSTIVVRSKSTGCWQIDNFGEYQKRWLLLSEGSTYEAGINFQIISTPKLLSVCFVFTSESYFGASCFRFNDSFVSNFSRIDQLPSSLQEMNFQAVLTADGDGVCGVGIIEKQIKFSACIGLTNIYDDGSFRYFAIEGLPVGREMNQFVLFSGPGSGDRVRYLILFSESTSSFSDLTRPLLRINLS